MQAVQAAFMAEEWVDHSLDAARKSEKAYEVAEKARAESEKRLREALTQLSSAERAFHDSDSALKSFER